MAVFFRNHAPIFGSLKKVRRNFQSSWLRFKSMSGYVFDTKKELYTLWEIQGICISTQVNSSFYCAQSLDRHGLIRIRSQRFVKFKQFRPASGYRGVALKKDRLISCSQNPPYVGQMLRLSSNTCRDTNGTQTLILEISTQFSQGPLPGSYSFRSVSPKAMRTI